MVMSRKKLFPGLLNIAVSLNVAPKSISEAQLQAAIRLKNLIM